MDNPKKRTRIKQGTKIRALLQKEIESRCPFCDNEQVGHFQIHHIDGNPSNHLIENLILVCPNCHSLITKGDIQFEIVKEKKKALGSNTNKIEIALITIDEKACSWLSYTDCKQAFYKLENEKYPFPILNFTVVNHTQKVIILTEISLTVKYLPNGLSGIPTSYMLYSLVKYRIAIPGANKTRRLVLDNQIVISPIAAAKFQVELYAGEEQEPYPPTGRCVLYFTLSFNCGNVSIAPIHLNCRHEGEKLTVYMMS